jgi:hypothetical protein
LGLAFNGALRLVCAANATNQCGAAKDKKVERENEKGNESEDERD